MKNANGMGTIYKLKGNRRKPYVAKIYAGLNDKFQPIQKPLGYYATKAEAMIALAEYHKQPYALDKVTVDDVFEKAIARLNITETTIRCYRLAYKKWIKPEIGGMLLTDLKLSVAQNVMDKTENSISLVQSCMKAIERYGLEYEFITKPFTAYLIVRHKEKKYAKTILSADEIHTINNTDDIFCNILKVYLYTGLRKNELVNCKLENIHLDSEFPYLIAGSKTTAGKNRTVPIHPEILSVIHNLAAATDNEYLLSNAMRQFFTQSGSVSQKLHKLLGSKHCLHEFRHTFRTELDRVGANLASVDKIMGHSNKNNNVGITVYTHKSLSELYQTICLVTYNIPAPKIPKNLIKFNRDSNPLVTNHPSKSFAITSNS